MLYTENISTLFCYLLTCSGLVELTNGLVEPLTLCETQNPVTVRDLSGGTIQHVQRTAGEPADECQLVLTGFSRSAYVSLPGVVEKQRIYLCPDRSTEIIINELQYCVIASEQGAIIPLTDGNLTLRLINQTVVNFTLDYYSNVDACSSASGVITIPNNAAYDQLSCIIANVRIGTQTCSTTIKNLQNRAVIVELLYYTTSDNGEAATFNEFKIAKADPRIFSNPGDELKITYVRKPSGSFESVVKLTVLTCGEVPQVQNTTSDSRNAANDFATAIWFSGSQVNYTCNEKGYEFRDVSSVTCQLDSTNQSLEWSNISDIKCIPVNHSPQKLEIIAGSTGGSIALIIAIITVLAIIITQRRRRLKLNQSANEINKDTGADLSAGPYEVVALERAGISTNKFQVEATTSAPSAETPTTNYTARQNESADVYAEVQAPKGHGQPSPSNLIRTPDPVYAEAPAVPAKLGEAGTPSPQPATDGVTMVDNSLYVSAAGGAYV